MPPNGNNPGKTKKKEELLFQIVVLVLAAIAGLGCWFAATALSRHDAVRGITPDKPRELVDFSLTNCTGRAMTRSDLNGKILAVSFLFTGCGVTCPVVSRHMAEIQTLTSNLPDVRLISLTVDPRSDTPPVLAKWAAHYDADTNRWYLLTGLKSVMQGLIGTSFLSTDADDPFNSMPCNFSGTERIAVVDKHGRVRVYFDGTLEGAPAAVAREIEKLHEEN